MNFICEKKLYENCDFQNDLVLIEKNSFHSSAHQFVGALMFKFLLEMELRATVEPRIVS